LSTPLKNKNDKIFITSIYVTAASEKIERDYSFPFFIGYIYKGGFAPFKPKKYPANFPDYRSQIYCTKDRKAVCGLEYQVFTYVNDRPTYFVATIWSSP
jgi:hypothetical protein